MATIKSRLPKEIVELRARVAKLQPKLQPLTEHQNTYFALSTAKASYDDCGTRNSYGWTTSQVKKVKITSEYNCATVIDRCEEFNVVRYFMYYHKYYKTKPNRHMQIGEVMQMWIAPDGKAVCYQRHLAMYHYSRYNPFSFGGDMIMKENGYKPIYETWYNHLLIRSTTPELKKRGLLKSTRGIHPELLITELLTNNYAETLWKAKKYNVLKFIIDKKMTTEQAKVFYTALKIANQHNYEIKDLSIYFDMVTSLNVIGKDIHNPKYVCPENLFEMHDMAVKKLSDYKDKEELKRLISESALYEAEYFERISKYLNICLEKKINGEKIKIFVCPTVSDMAVEGMKMHHCVYRCGYYKAYRNCLILLVRGNKDCRISTVELSTSTWEIVQNRGLCNHVPRHLKQVNKLIMNNIDLFKYAKKKINKPTQISIAA